MNRREAQRVREQNQVAVTVLASDAAPEIVNQTFFCPTEDLSATGLRLCLNYMVPVGALLSMRIAFRKPVRAFKHEGRVVWSRRGLYNGRPYALGVQFTQLQSGTSETWRRMLEHKLAEVPPPVRAAAVADEAPRQAS
jgi:hypothetical protein